MQTFVCLHKNVSTKLCLQNLFKIVDTFHFLQLISHHSTKRVLRDLSFWVHAARVTATNAAVLPPLVKIRTQDTIKSPLKVPLSCRLLPLGVWLHLLELVSLGTVIGSLARLSRAWRSGIRSEILPRRLAVQLRSLSDHVGITRCIKTMGARMQIEVAAASSLSDDGAATVLPSSLPPRINRLVILSCNGLSDKHLIEAARRFPRFASFSLHACTRCSDDGVNAVLTRYGQGFGSLSLGHFTQCKHITNQSTRTLIALLRQAQPENLAALRELELIDMPSRIFDASVLLSLLAVLPYASARPAAAAAAASGGLHSPKASRGSGGLTGSTSSPAPAPAAIQSNSSSKGPRVFSLQKLRLERRMPVGDDEDANRAFWLAAEEDAFLAATAAAAAAKLAGTLTSSLPLPVSSRQVVEDGDDFVTDKVLGVLGGGSFARLEVLSLAGMCEWQSAALQDLLLELPALHSLDLSRCEQVDDKMIKLVIARNMGTNLRSLSLRACPRLTDLCCASLTRSYFPRLEHLWLPATVTREAVRRLRKLNDAIVSHPFADLDEDGTDPIQVAIRAAKAAKARGDEQVPDSKLTMEEWSAKYCPMRGAQ